MECGIHQVYVHLCVNIYFCASLPHKVHGAAMMVGMHMDPVCFLLVAMGASLATLAADKH